MSESNETRTTCRQCKQPLTPGVTRCEHCGALVSTPAATEGLPRSKAAGRSLMLWSFAVVVGFVPLIPIMWDGVEIFLARKAIAALLLFFALVQGYRALAETADGALGGRGQAATSIVLSWLLVALIFVTVIGSFLV